MRFALQAEPGTAQPHRAALAPQAAQPSVMLKVGPQKATRVTHESPTEQGLRCIPSALSDHQAALRSSWAKPAVSFPPPAFIMIFYHVDLGGLHPGYMAPHGWPSW